MEETIQKLFSENPYFAFAGFVALVAVCLYIIKKLKNVIIAICISIIILGVYLYRTELISGDTISKIFNIKSKQDLEFIYKDFMNKQKDDLKKKAKEKLIETLEEDLKHSEKTE